MKNPFRITTLRPEDPFCDRERELDELVRHGLNGASVTLFSPRRYGKTSLILRVQDRIAGQGGYTVYADLYRVMSVDDLAGRLAKAVYEGLNRREPLLEKGRRAVLRFFQTYRPTFSPTPDGGVQIDVRPVAGLSGYDLLESLLGEIGRFSAECGHPVHVALDEFQDIVGIDKGKTEALLRAQMQTHDAAYLYAGSRRRILRAMFADNGRPFYNSSFPMELPPLPHEALTRYIRDRFADAGGHIPEPSAARVSERVEQYPYYAQMLGYFLFDGPPSPGLEDVDRAFDLMLGNERYAYQGIIDGLTSVQQAVLIGLAREPGAKPTSRAFLSAYGLSAGGVQKAVSHLRNQDYVVETDKGLVLVDPVFREWLVRTF
ncbi:ATPase [Pseudodesulfovibrio mercurii]|uniref:ATPase n=1 Tax=Pseudodesulfovibrio mercurii TaxID=641491 RepID=F0JJ25_9BACT|nr:ATPase [Pseudodesulfovibrio mercurii]EGB15924.1 ATPase [Pseudodesulfovibrio mercurii]